MADLSIKLKTQADSASFNSSIKQLEAQASPIKLRIEAKTGVGGLVGKSAKESAVIFEQFRKAGIAADDFQVKLNNLKMTGGLTQEQFDNFNDKLSGLRKNFKLGEITSEGFSDGMHNLKNEVSEASTSTKAMGQSLTDIIVKFTKWYLISGLVTGAIKAIKQMVAEVISLDASMVELNKVFDASSEELERVKDRAFELADGLGTTGKAVIDATTEFKRMGYTIDESLDLARVATMMTNVAEGITDAGEAANILTAILKGTGVSTEYAMSLLDRLNEVSNNNAISFDALAHMLQESAASMSVLGNNIDETIGMLTGAYAVIQDEKVGKALTTIGLRIAGLNEDLQEEAGLANDVSKALQKYAGINVFDEQTGQIRSTYEIMKDLAGVWDDLNKNEQTMLLNVLAGKQRADVAAAMLTNWEEVDKAIQDASNSMGSAVKEQEAYLNSIEGKIQSFKNVFQEISDTLIQSDLIKGIIDIGTGLLKIVRSISEYVSYMLKLSGISYSIKQTAIILNTIGDALNIIWSILEPIYNAAEKIFDWIYGLGNKLFGWIGDAVNWFGNLLGVTKEYDQETKDIAETFGKAEKEVSDYDRALYKLKNSLNTLNTANKETLENLKKQNEEIKNQKDLNDKLLTVEKARQELAEAKNKRVRIFRAGIGFTYETDVSAVQTAQESLQSAVDELSEFKYNLALSRAEEFVEKFTEILSGKEITEGWQELFDNFADLIGTEFEYFLTNAKKSIENFNSMLGEKDTKISLSSTSDISSGLTNGNITMPSTTVGQSANFNVGSISNPSPQIASAGKNITLQFNGPLEFPNVKNAEDASGFIDAVVSVGNSRVPKYN